MYSSVHDNIAHIAVQLQHNDRFSNCVLLCWLYNLYFSGRLEVVHRGIGCSYKICIEMVLQWHCLLCSTAIDCCSTGATVALCSKAIDCSSTGATVALCSTAIDCCSNFRHKLLDTERAVTSNIVTKGEPTFGHSSCLCAPKLFLISGKKTNSKSLINKISSAVSFEDISFSKCRNSRLLHSTVLDG
jgi:hypothetical protein